MLQLIRYHDSGQYYQDISNTIREATYYLKFRITQNSRAHPEQKLAVVMDIDETALSNYDLLLRDSFHITSHILADMGCAGRAIPYTLALFNYAKEHGVAVFFITNRPLKFKDTTIESLNEAGYHQWNGIAFNTNKIPSITRLEYYIHERERIVQQGYDIVINLGSNDHTLKGGYSDMQFKLPNPFYTR